MLGQCVTIRRGRVPELNLWFGCFETLCHISKQVTYSILVLQTFAFLEDIPAPMKGLTQEVTINKKLHAKDFSGLRWLLNETPVGSHDFIKPHHRIEFARLEIPATMVSLCHSQGVDFRNYHDGWQVEALPARLPEPYEHLVILGTRKLWRKETKA